MSVNGATQKGQLFPYVLNGKKTGESLTVQQCLTQWYHYLKSFENKTHSATLFSSVKEDDVYNKLQNDLQMMAGLLMSELVNETSIRDKGQYLQLVQALLVNCSDILYTFPGKINDLCSDAEQVLDFMQDFFYQHFDYEYKATAFCLQQFKNAFQLKLDYWKIKLQQSPLIDPLQECMNEKWMLPDCNISFRKIIYLKSIFQHVESATSIITETYVRDLLIRYNFNTPCFIEFETGLIKAKLNPEHTAEENMVLLRIELITINQLRMKQGFGFEINMPTVKTQLHEWVIAEIKRLELHNQRSTDKDLILDPESKIQTSLSVAKLAVLIRLMVADKIIINKTVAPMLRTVAKLFTTLQKDEISFGSLETKYHAPDKATLNVMKEMMQKWAALTNKL